MKRLSLAFLFIFLGVIAVIGSLILLAQNPALAKKLPATSKNLVAQIHNNFAVSEKTQQLQDTLSVAGQRTASVFAESQKVLGTAISVPDSQGNIPEKVAKYGTYLYCQEVVKQWDDAMKLDQPTQPEGN